MIFFYVNLYFILFLFLPLFYFLHEETGWHSFWKDNQNLGERKVADFFSRRKENFLFKKKEQEKKAREREQRRFSKRGLAAHMENRGRRKTGIHDFLRIFRE